jgi:signal transduction histidine kinase
MVALLWQEGRGDAAIRLEQLWNELSQHQSFDLLCGYPLSEFNREEHRESFGKICVEHSAVIPAESFSAVADEKDRLRTIALLQQAELALETESLERQLAKARTDEIQSQNVALLEQVKSRERAEDELQRFTRRLLTARDEEQRHIALELHENMAQLLAALSLYFGVLQEESGSLSPRVCSVVDSSRAAAHTLLAQVRKLSYLLHPPTLDDMGLASALKEYLEQLMECSYIRVELDVPSTLPRLPRKVEIAVFRIIEEALTNLRLNSGSPSAKVRVRCSAEEVLVEIHHRGDGIVGGKIKGQKDAAPSRLGLLGMRERARDLGGAINIKTDDQGTSIFITLPTGTARESSAQPSVVSS